MVRRGLLLVSGTFLVWLTIWALAAVSDVAVMVESHAAQVRALSGVAAAALALPLAVVIRRRPRLAADLVVMWATGLVAGLSTVGLRGTRWGMEALYADSSFRTQAVMRYADSAALADYAYADVPAYYPPAVGWLTGRFADLFAMPGWEAVKPMQILLAAVVPLLSYALWRRVLPVLPAACVVAAMTLLRGDLQKPDEWLVMACAVPWWLNAFRGVHADGVQPWRAWQHGVVAGLLLLTHTFDFLPLAVATLLGMAMDLVRRRRAPLNLRQLLVLVVVGLAVATPSWLGLAVEVAQGIPTDDLQRRYYFDGAGEPSGPDLHTFAGRLGAGAVAWLLLQLSPRVRQGRLAEPLALLLAAAYLTVLGGDVAAQHGVPLLTFKADTLLVSVYLILCVLAVAALGGWASRVFATKWRSAAPALVAGLTMIAAGVPAATYASDRYATGQGAVLAQTTRYPSGASPAGKHGVEPPVLPVFTDPGDPSAAATLRAWHRLSGKRDDSNTVLVTSRVELLATSTLHPFLTWKSIYSSPLGQWRQRRALLQQVSACADPTCAAELLRSNPLQGVDGLILEQSPDDPKQLVLPLLVDDFPDEHADATVHFHTRLFDGPEFRVRTLGRLVVIDVVPRVLPRSLGKQ